MYQRHHSLEPLFPRAPSSKMARTIFLYLFSSLLLLQVSYAQLKDCYFHDGASAHDFPCDPEADTSSCCGSDWICGTNLFCESGDGTGTRVVGSCTDRSWENPACPYALSMTNINRVLCCIAQTLEVDIDFHLLDLDHTVANYDHFDYKLNTTICNDGTVCPNNDFSTSNNTCCDNHQGRPEINYHNNAVLPDAASDLPGTSKPLPASSSLS